MTGHILRVTVSPDDPEERCGEVICPGVTDACRETDIRVLAPQAGMGRDQ